MWQKAKRILALSIYYGFAQYLPAHPVPGWQFAYWLRRNLVRHIFASCGEKVQIKSRAYFGLGSTIRIGDRSQLGASCRIEPGLVVGNDVIMGPEAVIMSSGREFDRVDITIRKQPPTPERPVTIGDDVWIGTRVTILPGVRIGNQAIIGAASVVTKDVPDRGIVAGNPARLLRFRGDTESHPEDD